MKICYITAFYDIGRDNWNSFNRNFNEYLECFYIYTYLFSKNELNKYKDIEYEMILYLDEAKLVDFLNKYNLVDTNIKIIPINDNFMKNNIWMWSRIDRETAIMESELYKNFLNTLNNRIIFPENMYPKYTLINHSKIDFINYTIINNLSDAEYYCWTDFGYLGKEKFYPNKLLDPFKFNLSKINYTLINPYINNLNPFINLIYYPEIISGGYFFGSKELMIKYTELYHKTLDIYQLSWLCDDDQAIVLYMCNIYTELFELHPVYKWNYAHIYFKL